jgi:hypothetical protein
LKEDAADAEHGADDSSEDETSEEGAAPVYNYRNRQQYR